ncbi:D-glycerate dehydrogenase [Arenibacter sp. GZD96]|uniref:2-hydroxyacid dehydrogenase n=1 Tax=Aurantibrevibacter litoralis TaxID=3106030 RepID=UPI002AFFA872|nr:D-glycerate dehydrogenase [Arenibacter sp. GZD-96]MEA1784922.1 D-glycerate dehydrogenase [Arenibacter sp. GZD-96]
MANKKILITRKFPEIGARLLREAGLSVTEWDEEHPMPHHLLELKAKEHNAIFSTLSDNLNAQFLKNCAHLDIISQFAVGYDNIDIPEATKLGIAIGYTPGAMSNATADTAFGLMIATSRKMFFMHKSIMKGDWGYFKPNAHLGLELKGKTLGIYGLGRIGMEMAKRCKGAYDMDLIYHNRTRNVEAEKQLNARYVSFETLLAQSDVLSVHTALTEATRGVFDKRAFSLMKPNALFINTARGGIHNEPDLIEALQQGTIWGAGLDVTNPEPMRSTNPLLQIENACVLPHIGSATIEARNEMARMAAANIIAFYSNQKVPHIVNPEVLKN